MEPADDTLEYASLVAKYPGYGFSSLMISEVCDTRQGKMFQKILPGLQYHVGLEALTEKASQPGGRGRKRQVFPLMKPKLWKSCLVASIL